MSGRFLGAAPSRADDAATRGYVDARGLRSFPPPAGIAAFFYPSHYIGSNATGAANTGAVYWEPFDIPPGGLAISGIGVNCTTAQVAGSATLVSRLGLYADDGTWAQPLLSVAGLLASGTVTPSALGNQWLTVALTLTPGRYWGAFLYTQSVAPTTAPQFQTLSTTAPLWAPSAATIGIAPRSLYLTGQAGLPTTTQTLTYQNGTTAPILALRAA